MGEPTVLKEANKKGLAIYVAAHCLLASWLSSGSPTTFKDFSALVSSIQAIKLIAPFILIFVISVLNRMAPQSLKESIIFWRLKYALPSYRAFTPRFIESPLVDKERVRSALGTDFPTDPTQQHRAWRRLYFQVHDSPSIQDAHKDYLLYRDSAWLTIPITLAAFLYLWKFHSFKVGVEQTGIAIATYLIVRFTAKAAGETLVRQALSIAGDSQPLGAPALEHDASTG